MGGESKSLKTLSWKRYDAVEKLCLLVKKKQGKEEMNEIFLDFLEG